MSLFSLSSDPTAADPGEEQAAQGEADTAMVLQVEEKAVVLSLRDSFMPSLADSDAVMFATLLADLFPNVHVPMIFENLGVRDGRVLMNDDVCNLEEIPAIMPKSRATSPVDKSNGSYLFF